MRNVLITGASSGFGSNVAVALAEQGWRVFAAMRDTAKAAPLLARCEISGAADRVIPVALDITDAASVTEATNRVLLEGGGTLDALLNNAGYSILGAFEDIGDAGCRAQMETNFFGALAVTRAVLPAMRAKQRGRIVIVTSNAVNTPHPMLSLYAASKWALEGWAEGLAMEVAPFGIRVVVMQPGAHRTPFAQHVEFVSSDASPYKPWLDAALPSVGDLDAWGRDPDLATEALVEAITTEEPPFRIMMGDDTRIFSALKDAFPYEARAFTLRAIIGAPAPDSYTDRGAAAPSGHHARNEVLQRLAKLVSEDPAAADVLARIFSPK